MKMSRKEFLRSIIGIGVGAAGISALAACGGSDGDDEPPVADGPAGNCSQNAPNVTVGSGGSPSHNHTMTVPKADVDAGAQKDYMMSNVSGHIHTLTVTGSMFATLKTGQSVMGTSSSDSSHTHSVMITCA